MRVGPEKSLDLERSRGNFRTSDQTGSVFRSTYCREDVIREKNSRIRGNIEIHQNPSVIKLKRRLMEYDLGSVYEESTVLKSNAEKSNFVGLPPKVYKGDSDERRPFF